MTCSLVYCERCNAIDAFYDGPNDANYCIDCYSALQDYLYEEVREFTVKI